MARYKNIGHVVYVSVTFFVFMTAFQTTRNQIETETAQNGFGFLGAISLALLYATVTVSSFFSALIVLAVGQKTAFFIAGCMYGIWVWSSLMIVYNVYHPATWVVICITSILNGFGGALLWVSQGSYLTDCSNATNRGFFNGLFWLIYQCSQIIGNVIAAFVVEDLGVKGFTFIMGAFSIVGALMFLAVRKPEKPDPAPTQALPPPPSKVQNDKELALMDGQKQEIDDEDDPLKKEEQEGHATDFDRIIDQGRPTVKVRKSTKRAKPVPQVEPPKRPTVLQGVKNMFKFLCDKKLSLMLLWFISNGVLVALYSGYLPFFIDLSAGYSKGFDDSEQEYYTDLAMILFGVGEAAGGIAIGAILDKMGNRFGLILTFIYMVISWILIFVASLILRYNALWYIAALFTGLADSSHTTTNTSLLGTEYKGKKEPFAVFRFCRGIGGLVFFILEAVLQEVASDKGYTFGFMISVAVVYVVAFILTFMFPVTPLRRKEAQPKNVK